MTVPLKDMTGNFTTGLLVLGGCALVGAIVAMTLKESPAFETAGMAEPVSSH